MHSPSTQVSEESLHEGYEVSDIHTGVISGCLVALAIIMISALFAIIIIIRGFDGGRAPLNNTEASPLQAHDVFAPGAPQLQQDPVGGQAGLCRRHESESRILRLGQPGARTRTGAYPGEPRHRTSGNGQSALPPAAAGCSGSSGSQRPGDATRRAPVAAQ
jgi:hypothetical protein